jgi:hypothetical protein
VSLTLIAAGFELQAWNGFGSSWRPKVPYKTREHPWKLSGRI